MSIEHKSLQVGNLNREYWVLVPEAVGVNPPVLMFFHQEGSGDPDLVDTQTHLGQVAEEEGFVLVIPIAVGQVGQEIWDYRGNQDVDFILALLADLKSSVLYDKERVYAAGIGLGAAMVNTLGTDLGQKIAALGMCSGGPVREPETFSSPSRYVPVVVFHSAQDVQYPIAGGLGMDLLDNTLRCSSVQEAVNWWVLNNKSPETPETESLQNASLLRYGDLEVSDRRSPVWWYRQDSGGHTWPGGQDILDGAAGEVDMTLDASRLIWDFVSRFRLTQPHQIFDFHLHGQYEDHADSTANLWRKGVGIKPPRI